MENLRKLNYVLGGGINENSVYMVTLVAYGNTELNKQKVSDFIDHLVVSGYFTKAIETQVIEVPRDYIEEDAIGELRVSGIKIAELNYKIEYDSNTLSEITKSLEEFRNTQPQEESEKELHNLMIKNTENKLENLRINLELKTKLASLL